MDKAKMIELTPCPFCGGEPHAYCRWEGGDINVSGGKMWGVKCERCGCDMPPMPSREKATRLWNRRAGDVLDELCEQCSDHLVQGDWTTVDGRKLCSLCAYYAYGEGK